MNWFGIWVIYGIVFAGFSMWLAEAKDRSVLRWGLLALIFGLPALVALAGAPRLDEAEKRRILEKELVAKDLSETRGKWRPPGL